MEALIVLLLIGGVVFFVLKSKNSKDKAKEVKDGQVNPIPDPKPGDDTSLVDPINRGRPGTDPINRNPVDPISRD